MKVQFLFFDGCPNVEVARARLRKCLQAEGLAPQFEEIDVGAENTSQDLAGWGSPTILIDGQDVAGAVRADATSCRFYGNNDGAPSEELIRAALRQEKR